VPTVVHPPDRFDARPSPRILFGPGRLAELPQVAGELGASRVLLVTDAGLLAAGHVDRARELLEQAGLEVHVYGESHVNPSESDIERCRRFAQPLEPDLIVGFGGGSSMDTAKGCNFLLHHGGRMADFRGYGHASRPMLPFVAIPTTAGTGSECQSYAVVSRDETHEKMACGDPKALARVAILDPELTVSQPPAIATLTALDALSHALESAVCTKRNPISTAYSRQAFSLAASALEAVLRNDADLDTRGRMLLGAAMAGSAIENSMLGGAHATANPLTARYEVPHGHAVALMLPHVIRFNSEDPAAAATYAELGQVVGRPLLDWLDAMLDLAALETPRIDPGRFPPLAADAAGQWTAQFNPRPLDHDALMALYQAALAGEPVLP